MTEQIREDKALDGVIKELRKSIPIKNITKPELFGEMIRNFDLLSGSGKLDVNDYGELNFRFRGRAYDYNAICAMAIMLRLAESGQIKYGEVSSDGCIRPLYHYEVGIFSESKEKFAKEIGKIYAEIRLVDRKLKLAPRVVESIDSILKE